MLTQAQQLDQLGLTQQELGGMFGNYAANAANQAGGNLVSGMSGAAGNTQNAGMARAGGWIGAGNTVGGMFDTPTPPVTYNTNYNTSGNNPFGY